jgi:hypothetical protein
LPACDQGDAAFDSAVGPALHVISSYPKPGAGTDCLPGDQPDCGVPVNLAFELRFNRMLLPATIGRSNVEIYTGDHRVGVAVNPEYDPLERVITFRPFGPLLPGVLYTFEAKLPDEQGNGLKAFDGALLEEGPAPLTFRFFTERAPSTLAAIPADPTVPDCSSIRAAFQRARCASEGCHGGAEPSLELDLSSAKGIRETAVHRVARETDLGDGSGVTLESPARFGVGMPRIDPMRPEHSYLLYKLVVNSENFRWSDGSRCRSTHWAPLSGGACPEPSADERARLQDWFVLGDPMPPPGHSALHREDLEAIQQWIRAGADCGAGSVR